MFIRKDSESVKFATTNKHSVPNIMKINGKQNWMVALQPKNETYPATGKKRTRGESHR